MKAVLVERPGAAVVATVEDPKISRNEVLVRVLGCGVCGTDHHIVNEGLSTAVYPLIPGHEGWGQVVETADSASELRVGQLVAIDPSLHCGVCRRCRRGQGNLCERWGSIGGTQPGEWAELVAVPQRNGYALPEDYPTEVAVLIEPVACLLRGLRLLGPQLDTSGLVYGAGTMGVLWVLALRLAGVGVLGVVELDKRRRELCERTFDVRCLTSEEAASIEADYVIDATGAASAMEAAVWHCRPGGTVMFFGVAGEEIRVPVSPFRLYQREIRILSSMAILHTYPDAVDFVAKHAELLQPMVTDVVPLAKFAEAIHAGKDRATLKMAIDPSLR